MTTITSESSTESKSCVPAEVPNVDLQAVPCGRMAHPRAGVDIVIAESRPNHLLDQIRFFVGAARRSNAADRIAPVLRLNPLEFAGARGRSLLPNSLPATGSVIFARIIGFRIRSWCVA